MFDDFDPGLSLGQFPYFLIPMAKAPLAPFRRIASGFVHGERKILILIEVMSNMASMCGPPRPVSQYRDLMEVKGLVRSIEVSNAYYPHTEPGLELDSARGKYKI